MSPPRLLDLFCGMGGASAGYSWAGFEVTGVDINPALERRYPFPFILGDALEYLRDHGREYDAIHASPPCQKYSRMHGFADDDHPELIDATRELLNASGRPWVIENVDTAPMRDYITLCGTMFGLRVRRHRRFEIHPRGLVFATPGCSCRGGVKSGRLIAHIIRRKDGTTQHTESDRRLAIGVDWMTARDARQAIPPAYTEFIGQHLIARINGPRG